MFQQLHTEVLSPTRIRMKKLERSVELMAAELAIKTAELAKFELYKRDKTTDRRLQARGRLLPELMLRG